MERKRAKLFVADHLIRISVKRRVSPCLSVTPPLARPPRPAAVAGVAKLPVAQDSDLGTRTHRKCQPSCCVSRLNSFNPGWVATIKALESSNAFMPLESG